MKKYKSLVFTLEEVMEDMPNAIKSTEEVLAQQKELIEIVKKQKKTKNDFKDFIRGLEEQTKVFEKRIENNKIRFECLKEVLSYVEPLKDIHEPNIAWDREAMEKAYFVDDLLTKLLIAIDTNAVNSIEEIKEELN